MQENKQKFRAVKFRFETDAGTYWERYMIVADHIPLFRVNQWLELKSIRKASTGLEYAKKIAVFLNWLDGCDISFENSTNRHVRQFLHFLVFGDLCDGKIKSRQSTVSSSTLNQFVTIITGFYRWLDEVGQTEMIWNSKTVRANRSFLYGQIYSYEYRYLVDGCAAMLRPRREYIKWYGEEEKQYLENMAGAFTGRRQLITYNLLISSIFHDKKCSNLSIYHDRFLDLLTSVVEAEREKQKTVFIAENRLQIDIHSDVWKVYEQYGDVMRLKTINFLSIRSPSLRYEMRYYLRHMYERAGKVNVPLFSCQYMALNALTEVNPNIKYFADITEADARALLLFLENTRSKKHGTHLSQYYIAKAMSSVRQIIDYLMGNMRD